MPRKKAPYSRATAPRGENKADPEGTVFVRMGHLAGGKYAKGTLSKSMTVQKARVVDVYRIIEEALFGGQYVPPKEEGGLVGESASERSHSSEVTP